MAAAEHALNLTCMICISYIVALSDATVSS